MYLFFDTETSGLPDYNLPLTHPDQPKILSIAMILTDEAGREMVVYKAPTLLPGYVVDEAGRAFEVNKIGTKDLEKYGFDFKTTLRMWRALQDRAILKIAHNYRFDGFLMKAAHEVLGIDPGAPLDRYCTMKGIKEITGKGSLADAHQHVHGRPIADAHDSLSDARACKDVFFWLKQNGHFKPQERKEAA